MFSHSSLTLAHRRPREPGPQWARVSLEWGLLEQIWPGLYSQGQVKVSERTLPA